jgi:uncharacterized protein (UPF0548 family)
VRRRTIGTGATTFRAAAPLGRAVQRRITRPYLHAL